MKYEGFSTPDAEYAVDAQNVDWNLQAAKTAASYLKVSSFSYAGLVKQLEFEGYTSVQAQYGVTSTGLTNEGGTPTPSSGAATPQPTATPSGTSNLGCQVSFLSSLPYASQRIAATSITFEKDSLGYLMAWLNLRNDNSMALRLVEFTFSFFNKGSLIITTSTLEGDHHFYIQDDSKFNSFDGASGPWLPNQTRKFKIPTNQILDCSSITVITSGFVVKQGIGAS